MSLVTNLQTLATRIATEFKTVYGRIGDLTGLATTDKTSLVAAINEVNNKPAPDGGAQINDTGTSTTSVWSSNKTNSEIGNRVSAVVDAAPGTLDTLNELAAALGDDPNFATTVATDIGNRVRYDAAQALTGAQQTQARANIGAGTSNLVIGITGTTAAAGNHTHTATDIGAAPASHTHTAAQISDATATGRSVVTAADASAARTAIGAGTSNLVIGTTAGTAADAGAVGDTNANFVTTFEAGLL